MKRISTFMSVIMIFLITSCHLLEVVEDGTSTLVQSVTFNESVYTVQAGMYTSCYITVTPASVLDTYETQWSLDSDAAKIEYTTNTTCMIKGLKKGTCKLKAVIADGESQTAIVVTEE